MASEEIIINEVENCPARAGSYVDLRVLRVSIGLVG